MSSRCPAASVGTLLLLAASAAVAQGVPEATPSPASSEDQGILLAYKFRVGQQQKFRGTVQIACTLSIEGNPSVGGRRLEPFPYESRQMIVYTEKVTGLKDGAGTISLSPFAADTSTEMLGSRTVARLVNGKMVVTNNGKPVRTGSTDGVSRPAPTSLLRSAQGNTKVSGNPASPANADNPLFGGLSLGATVQFPDRPVKVGETWETRRRFAGQGLGSGLRSTAGTVEKELTHTLKEIQRKGSRQIAVIETTANSTETPPGGAKPDGRTPTRGILQTTTGLTYFDVGRGVVTLMKFSADATAHADPPRSLPPLDTPEPPLLRVDGHVDLTLTELAEAPATSPARAKPAAKPTRPRR